MRKLFAFNMVSIDGFFAGPDGNIDWHNVIRGNIADEVTRLQRQASNDIVLMGSANPQSSLMELDLIDEYRLMVTPAILGGGTPLFKDRRDRLALKLTDSRVFRSGNVLLSYQPRRTR